jgi:hypothetical protein
MRAGVSRSHAKPSEGPAAPPRARRAVVDAARDSTSGSTSKLLARGFRSGARITPQRASGCARKSGPAPYYNCTCGELRLCCLRSKAPATPGAGCGLGACPLHHSHWRSTLTAQASRRTATARRRRCSAHWRERSAQVCNLQTRCVRARARCAPTTSALLRRHTCSMLCALCSLAAPFRAHLLRAISRRRDVAHVHAVACRDRMGLCSSGLTGMATSPPPYSSISPARSLRRGPSAVRAPSR